jgi:hypothetical protein
MTMTICLFINLTNPSESPTPHAADTDGLPGHVWSSKQQIDRGRRRWRWPRLEGKRKATTVGWTGVVGARSGANPRQAAGTGKRRFRGDRWRIRPIGGRRSPKRPHRIASHRILRRPVVVQTKKRGDVRIASPLQPGRPADFIFHTASHASPTAASIVVVINYQLGSGLLVSIDGSCRQTDDSHRVRVLNCANRILSISDSQKKRIHNYCCPRG